MAIPFTVTEPLGRVPTFLELQPYANQFGIEMNGNETAGVIKHSKATGKYAIEKNGEIRGDFTGQYLLITLSGEFGVATGKAEITVTHGNMSAKLAAGKLRSEISKALKIFCAKFSPLA
jgi:hypothetical protein